MTFGKPTLQTKKCNQVLAALFCLLAFASCQKIIDRDLQRARNEAAAKNWRLAVSSYQGVLEVEPTSEQALAAAREGAKIATLELDDHSRAAPFYRHLIYYSPLPAEALAAQKSLVDIYFSQIQDYPKAIEEISRLLGVERDASERLKYHTMLARCYFHLKNFNQALAELSEISRLPQTPDKEFEVKLLKANVLTATQRFSEATILLKELMEKWRDKSVQENVPMSLAVCYEEQHDFKSAILLLESVKSSHAVPEYVELRIKRLRERSLNQPGARGYRK